MHKNIAYILLIIVMMHPQFAMALTVPERVSQGSLVVGKVNKGFRVFHDRQQIPVTPEGFFFLGFHRDATGESQIVALSPDGVQVSRRVTIEEREWPIQRIRGLPQAMVTPPPEIQERIRKDNEKIAAVRRRVTREPLFASGFIWPVEGTITSVFGAQRILNDEPRRFHNGIDIAAPEGTPILAAADGIVALAETDMYYTGGTVMLDHGYGLNSVYVHMKDVRVKLDQRVRQGELIGTVGKTGRATGSHLHWGVAVGSTHIDPEQVPQLQIALD